VNAAALLQSAHAGSPELPAHPGGHILQHAHIDGKGWGAAAALAALLPLLLLARDARAACAPRPPVVADIDANSYYVDRHHAVVDPLRKARNEAAVRPVNDYLAMVARAANRWQAGGDAADARCALAWLDDWAGRRALQGTMTTEQSYYTRTWTLAGLALNYARVRAAATPVQRASIEPWLRGLAAATVEHSAVYKGVRNNHYYWEGLAVAAAGAVTDDAASLAWGRKAFEHAMTQVRADGALPYELARGPKALHYHLFAAGPLVMLASILDVQAPQLDRLVHFAMAGLDDPVAIALLSDSAQERPEGVPGWVAVYRRHAAYPGVAASAPAPAWDARLGGDMGQPNPLEHVRTR
jgi:poly(beta-D-mannuronate) lyase